MEVKRTSGPLHTKRLDNGKRQITRDLTYRINDEGEEKEVTVRACDAFTTEFSSVPCGLRWFVHWTRIDTAGVIHDYLYRSTRFTRLKDDLIWFKVAIQGRPKALPWQAWGGLIGMRLIGWFFKSTGQQDHGQNWFRRLFARIRRFWAAALLNLALLILLCVLAFMLPWGWFPLLLLALIVVLNLVFRA